MTAAHCAACAIAEELEEHRDAHAETWSVRRGMLSFCIVVARRHCTAYKPEGGAAMCANR